MIKPSSSKCNLKCKYCFYHSIADARDIKDYGFMSKETLRQIVSKVDDYCDGGNCNIGFQGGESLLVGLDFYKELVKLIMEQNLIITFKLMELLWMMKLLSFLKRITF